MKNSENHKLTVNWIFASLACAIRFCTVKECRSELQ